MVKLTVLDLEKPSLLQRPQGAELDLRGAILGFLSSPLSDDTCRIWDLRTKKKRLYVIPAHQNLISEVKFEPQEGYYLLTASFDTTAKVWSGRDFKTVKTLQAREAKVTALDIASDSQHIVTVSHDRSVKLWIRESVDSKQDMD